jgi:hypothetical protein
MSRFPETFVDTPLGRLRVWASGEGTPSAATLRRHEKVHYDYRDNVAAQGCAEHLVINRVAYTVVVHLRPASDFPADGGVGERLHRHHGGWGINEYGVTLRRADRYEGPSGAARHKAEDILLPVLAEFANSGAGRRLLAQAATARRRERIAELGREIAGRQAELQHLQTELTELERVDASGPTDPQDGGGAR